MRREPQNSMILVPRFQRGAGILHHTGGTYSHNDMMDYPRFPSRTCILENSQTFWNCKAGKSTSRLNIGTGGVEVCVVLFAPRIHLFACTQLFVSNTFDCGFLFVYKHQSTALCFKHIGLWFLVCVSASVLSQNGYGWQCLHGSDVGFVFLRVMSGVPSSEAGDGHEHGCLDALAITLSSSSEFEHLNFQLVIG